MRKGTLVSNAHCAQFDRAVVLCLQATCSILIAWNVFFPNDVVALGAQLVCFMVHALCVELAVMLVHCALCLFFAVLYVA